MPSPRAICFGVTLALISTGAYADDEAIRIVKPRLRATNFAASPSETVSVGYLSTSTDPNKVGVGGVWDFDTDIAGTDSTQGWHFLSITKAGTEPGPSPEEQLHWYYAYGNAVNVGDHALWKERLLQGRTFRRYGVAGVWHADHMSGVSSPISGTRSAWCGLRHTEDANATQLDQLTGNPYTNEASTGGGLGFAANYYPGYADGWDQILYRDFPYEGDPIALSFRVRASLSSMVPNVGEAPPGGWFNPNPAPENIILNVADSLMVWVGRPLDTGVYDPNRRWLSEVLDFSSPDMGQPRKLVALTGKIPVNHAGSGDSTAQATIPGGLDYGSTVRVAFQLKTNATFSDETGSGTFNTIDGAALIDDVVVGGISFDFESAASVRPRVLLDNTGAETWIDPASVWITTGRPPNVYGHVENVAQLPYGDPLGGVGDPNRICNLAGNVLVHSSHDDPQHDHARATRNWAVSPTIAFVGPRAAMQGILPSLRQEATRSAVEFDYYAGNDGPPTGVFFYVRYRMMTPILQSTPEPMQWSDWASPGIISSWGDSACVVIEIEDGGGGYNPFPMADSIQIAVYTQVLCGQFGSSDCGAARGAYFDNIRFKFIREGTPFTDVEDRVPGGRVQAAFPNPTPDGSTTIRFELPKAAPVTIRFYDVRGGLVSEQSIEGMAGPNRFWWDGRAADGERLAPGMYYYRVQADGLSLANESQRLVVIRTVD
jgi:hypothetical protein